MHFNLIKISFSWIVSSANHTDEEQQKDEADETAKKALKNWKVFLAANTTPSCELSNDKIGSLARLFDSYTSISICISR